MALWGNSTSDEAKPKWLTTEQKEDIIANEHGWVAVPGGKFTGNGNTSASPEILCFIKGLSGKVGVASDVSFDLNFSSWSRAAGGTLSVTANFNEAVTVTGTPQLTVVNSARSNHTLSYASGSGTKSLTFTLVIGTDNAAIQANDVLDIGTNAISLNSGTIKDTSGDSVSTPQTVTSTVTTGSTTFPTATLDNQGRSFGTTAALGAVTAKVVSATVAAGGSGHAVNDVVTIADGFGTGTNAKYKVTAISGGGGTGPATALEITVAGAYTAIASGVAAIAQESTTGSGSSLTVNVTLGVSAVAVGTAGTNYSGPPIITFAGTGLDQAEHTCAMAGRAATITNTDAIGALAGSVTAAA